MIEYRSEGRIPIHLGSIARKNWNKDQEKVVVEGHRKFYLWGLYPKKHVVLMDSELENLGVISALGIEIEEYQKISSFVKTLLTFGLYMQIDYKVRGVGMMRHDWESNI